jgi:hypothetical protein
LDLSWFLKCVGLSWNSFQDSIIILFWRIL